MTDLRQRLAAARLGYLARSGVFGAEVDERLADEALAVFAEWLRERARATLNDARQVDPVAVAQVLMAAADEIEGSANG